MPKYTEEKVRDYKELLEKASSTSDIIDNDNIMNTYCVLLWMLNNCRNIAIYCGEARLFSEKGKIRLEELLEKSAAEKLYKEVIDALFQFVSVKENKLSVICERQPAEWDKGMLQSLREPNVEISTLNTDKAPYLPFHFMIGDDKIYRRETDHEKKKGRVRFFLDSCKVLRKAFLSYNKEYFVKQLKIA